MRKLLMNCDQVFDVLTRGPFPTGDESDESVEQHLRACHECRQLAEALQPAVELLHESLARDEASDLPEYQGVLSAIERSVVTAEAERPRPLAVRRLAQPREERCSPLTLSNFTQLAVVAMLLVAVGSLTWSVMTTPHERNGELLGGVFSPSGSMTRGRLDDRGLMTLASLNLPARCFPQDALIDAAAANNAKAPLAINQAALHCCTECHRAGQSSGSHSRLVVAMHKSCVACHSL